MQQAQRKKTIFSGIQPTGVFTLGNYLGAVRNWSLLQDDYDCLYCVVDLHALTVRQVPAELRQACYRSMALLLSTGLDPEKNTMYLQSHVSGHSELGWLLNCYTYVGELSRMTQFKEKSERHADNINAGLYDYPVLMAADILLYNADLVPVGNDQKQHIELTRDVAIRFNNIYGPTFTVPEPYIPKAGARIMSLADPTKKMSKSDENPNASVFMLDPPEVIVRKFKRAVTDSDGDIRFSEDKPGISNLINIYSCATGMTVEQIESECAGLGYGDFKARVADSVVELLRPVQEKFAQISNDKAYLNEVLKQGAQKASYRAARTLSKVQKRVGLVLKER